MRNLLGAILGVVALALLVLFFLKSPTQDESLARPGASAPELAADDTTLVDLPLETERVVLPAPEAASDALVEQLPEPDLNQFEFTVEVRDSKGLPYSGVQVQVAPPDHPFVAFAATDMDGIAVVSFGALGERLVVDLALVDADNDLAGFHRLTLSRDKSKAIRVSIPRQSKFKRKIRSKIELARARGREMAAERLASRGSEQGEITRRRRRPTRPSRYPASKMSGFNIFGSTEKELGVDYSSESYQAQLDGIEDDIGNENEVLDKLYSEESGGTVTGMVLNGAGEPLVLCPVWAEFSGPRDVASNTVYTSRDGSFSLNVLPGEVRCYVGQGEDLLVKDFTIGEGETVQWHPVVSVTSMVRLSLPSELVDESSSYQVQANFDDGQVLTITRRRFDVLGQMLFPVHSSAPVSLHLMYIERQSAYPIHHIGYLSGGDSRSLESADCRPQFGTATAASVEMPGVRRVCSPEALVLLSDESWGYRARLSSGVGELSSVLIPLGNWRVDMSLGPMGRQSLGPISVESLTPFALPSFAMPTTGVLKLNSLSQGLRSVSVTQIRSDIVTRTFESEHVFQVERGLKIPVLPGEYRVEVSGEDGAQFSGLVTVVAGLTASLDV